MLKSGFRYVLVVVALVACCWYGLLPANSSEVQSVRGAWLSPDWLFPGPVSYSEQDVRRIAHDTLVNVKKQGINNVFFETMLRGTTICAPTVVGQDGVVRLAEGAAQYASYPVYRPLAFDFRIENNAPVDTLQIFIDEGQRQGIRVHAWCHMFYWRMDNSDLVPAWKEGHSAWDDLMTAYLRQERNALALRLPANDPLLVAMDRARELFVQGYNGAGLETILNDAKIPQEHNPVGSLLKAMLAAGANTPDFLLITSPEDPFPQPKHKLLRAMFVDPENARVQNRIIGMVSTIARSHPGLAGVQLDHVRYPTGPVGTPPELGLLGLGVNDFDYFDASNPILNERYERTVALLTHRREVLQAFVNRLRRYIGGGLQLSAAILPEYHRNRNEGRYRISYWEFISQDWYHWDVDFVVPLMYETPAWKIRTLMIRYREDLEGLFGDQIPIRIYPGVSRLQQAESGLLEQDDWVFFDLKLADDTHVAREQQVDPVGDEPTTASASPAPQASASPTLSTVPEPEVHPVIRITPPPEASPSPDMSATPETSPSAESPSASPSDMPPTATPSDTPSPQDTPVPGTAPSAP